MKNSVFVFILLLVFVFSPAAAAADPGPSAFEILPISEPDPESDFGVDVNVNMDTIDSYLNLSDAVYRDMRMPVDPFDYNAIGGSSIASATIEGFAMIPYPKLDKDQKDYISSLRDTTEIGAIPVTVSDRDLEFVYTCLEVLNQETATFVIPTWYETALKIKYADDPKDAKMIDLIHDSIDKPFVVTYNSILDGFMIGCFGGPLAENSNNFASFYKSREKSANAAAKTVYEKFEKNLADGN